MTTYLASVGSHITFNGFSLCLFFLTRNILKGIIHLLRYLQSCVWYEKINPTKDRTQKTAKKYRLRIQYFGQVAEWSVPSHSEKYQASAMKELLTYNNKGVEPV